MSHGTEKNEELIRVLVDHKLDVLEPWCLGCHWVFNPEPGTEYDRAIDDTPRQVSFAQHLADELYDAGCMDHRTITTTAEWIAFGHDLDNALHLAGGLPPRESSPRPAPGAGRPLAPERLRLWSHSFQLIEELPAIVKQRDEGWIAIPCRGRLAQKLLTSMSSEQLMWLSVDGPDGRWIGRLNTLLWQYDRDDTLLVEFHPEPEYLGTEISRAGWFA